MLTGMRSLKMQSGRMYSWPAVTTVMPSSTSGRTGADPAWPAEAAVQVWLRSGQRKRRPTHALSSTPSGKCACLDESTDSDDDTEMGSDSDSDCSDR